MVTISMLRPDGLSGCEQPIQPSPGEFHALAMAARWVRWRPGPDLSGRLYSGAVLLTGLSPFITVFHYCTKSR